MTFDLREYTNLKESYEAKLRKQERNKGALEQLLSQLKTEYGIDNVKDAEKLLVRMTKQIKNLEQAIEWELERIEQQYWDFFNG